jgi:NADH dehydrogenase [ubiquinone] 1 alpha subcomplex assembly factor 5
VKREFAMVLQIGPGSVTHPKIKTLFHMDMAGDAHVIADEEFLPFADASLDLIICTMNLHCINDLPGAMIQMKRALKPDGLFVAAMPGGETLYELREALMQAELSASGGASPRVFPFADKQQMGGLMQRAGFALPVVDSEIVRVTYDHVFKLLRDLRGMGEGNSILERNRKTPGKSFFAEAAQIYADKFSEDGRITATFEMIFLIGWAPHSSQQQPLKPGSANLKLADALATQEIKTGAKARP